MSHEHKFVPVDVLWLNLWSNITGDFGKKKPIPPKIGWLVLACECGAIKTRRAWLENGNTMLAEYMKVSKK